MLSAALLSYGKLSVFLPRETMPIVIELNDVMLNAEAPVTESYLRLSIITLGIRYIRYIKSDLYLSRQFL